MNNLRDNAEPFYNLFKTTSKYVCLNEFDLRESYDTYYYLNREDISIEFPNEQCIEKREYVDENRVRTGEYTLPQPFVAKVPNVTLVGHPPLAFTDDYKLIIPAVVKERIALVNIIKNIKSMLINPIPKRELKTSSIESGLLLFNGWSSNYSHWMFDDLLRVQFLQESRILENILEGNDIKIIIPNNPADWQLELLELLGISDEMTIPWEYDLLYVDELLVPSKRRDGVTSKSGIDWLRNTVLEKSPDKKEYSNKIYISRSDASRRRVVNENELMSVLKKRGYEKYTMSDLSVCEQASVFHNADRIVSPYGSNLANVMYSTNADLVCLNSSEVYDPFFFELASHVDTRFYTLMCETYASDIRVDIQNLIGLLNDIDDD